MKFINIKKIFPVASCQVVICKYCPVLKFELPIPGISQQLKLWLVISRLSAANKAHSQSTKPISVNIFAAV